MGVNKVDLANGEILLDLTADTVTPETLAEGETAHNSKGERIVGTMTSEGGSGGGSNVVIVYATAIISSDSAEIIYTADDETYDLIEANMYNSKLIVLVVSADYGDGLMSYWYVPVISKIPDLGTVVFDTVIDSYGILYLAEYRQLVQNK